MDKFITSKDHNYRKSIWKGIKILNKPPALGIGLKAIKISVKTDENMIMIDNNTFLSNDWNKGSSKKEDSETKDFLVVTKKIINH